MANNVIFALWNLQEPGGTKPGTTPNPYKTYAKRIILVLAPSPIYMHHGTVRNQAGTKPEPSQNITNNTIFVLWNHQDPSWNQAGTKPECGKSYYFCIMEPSGTRWNHARNHARSLQNVCENQAKSIQNVCETHN